MNLNSRPDSIDQHKKIAEYFHIDLSVIQEALEFNYKDVYIDVRNSKIICSRKDNEIEYCLKNYEGDPTFNNVLLFDHEGLNEIATTNFDEIVSIDLSSLSEFEFEMLSSRFYFNRLFWLKLRNKNVMKFWWNFNIRQIIAVELNKKNGFSVTDYFIYFDDVLIGKLKSIECYSILNDFNWLIQKIINVKRYDEKIDFLRKRDLPSIKILDDLLLQAIKNDFFELAIPIQKIIQNLDTIKTSNY